MTPARIWAVVPAAGRGTRFTGPAGAAVPKQYLPLAARSVVEWALHPLLACPRIEAIILPLAANDSYWPGVLSRLNARELLAGRPPGRLQVALGGATRAESVSNALTALVGKAAATDWVLVHDAARPCLTAKELDSLLAALDAGAPGAVLAAPIADTVKRKSDAGAVETVERRGLWRALTPQVFAFGALRAALANATAAGAEITDESAAMERAGLAPLLVAGSPFNIKVTDAADLATAQTILVQRAGADGGARRIGQGFDVHAFMAGNHVVLGGVRIAHDLAVRAHSDGDVVIHALCDALLGALGMGDIGVLFPDSDAKWRGADSRVFLREVAARVRAAGWGVENADITVLAEAPKVFPHREAMRQNLAADLSVAVARISIKATTTETLGFIGRNEGLAASAVVLLAPVA
jgi:2-C-methyl-D-erythritol 4-phosphate cytidylyltransferase / 2-C-methyl-D-erythritol 2,4-cyclodiphosphate synthase